MSYGFLAVVLRALARPPEGRATTSSARGARATRSVAYTEREDL